LIGAQTLVAYNDDKRTSRPYPSTALHGPFTPQFAPDYPSDRRIVMGGQRIGQQGAEATVFVCTGAVCEGAALPGEKTMPDVRLPVDFSSSGSALAFTPDALYASNNGARSFRSLASPSKGVLREVTFGLDNSLLAAVESSAQDGGGVFLSEDDGRTWSQLGSTETKLGSVDLVVAGEVLIAALEGRGLMCSSDSGATWAARCS
jgi:hypothetical protein